MHAIADVKNTINYFNKRGSTVNLGLIDIRKAFDKVSFWGILLLLQRKKIHPDIIQIIENLFLGSSATIKWNGAFSMPVDITAGVRQGGVLSPLLFAAYVDIVLTILEESNLGCYINKRCLNSFLYADDLILIAPSVLDLQSLLSLSSDSFLNLGLEINPGKSYCLRVGNRCRATCQDIKVNGKLIPWVSEARYLGIVIKRNTHFACNWFDSRGSFYRAVNSILGSLGPNPRLDVILKLFQSTCVPILSYGISAISLSQTELRSLTYAYNSVFVKRFKIYNADTIEQCQFFCKFLPFYAYYDYLRFCFLRDKLNHSLLNPRSLFDVDKFDECDLFDLRVICNKYNLLTSCSKYQVKCMIWKYVETNLFD